MIDNLAYHYIDPQVWGPIVREDPLWHQHGLLKPQIRELFAPEGNSPSESMHTIAARSEIARFFGYRLRNNQVALGDRAEYFNDDDRVKISTRRLKPGIIDTIGVHHTALPEGISLDDLNAWGLLRLYAPIYHLPAFQIDGQIQPISSGHYLQRGPNFFQQVFWGYHFIVRRDGTAQRLLKDGYTAFHAGIYDVNVRSIGIVLDGDFSDQDPPEQMIEQVARIAKRYPNTTLLGHREIKDTICPGNTFLGENGWKTRILRATT